MGLRDRIEEFRTNNEKRRIIKEINKNKNFDRNIRLIIEKYLDDDELFRIMLDNLDRIDESLFEEIIEKLNIDTILSNDVLLDRVCIYYSKEIKIFINSPFDIKLIDKLNMLIENDKFKSKINEIIDIESLGEKYYANGRNFQIYNHNSLSKFEKVNELLSKLGFKIDDDCILAAFIYGDAKMKSKLMELDKINENVVDRLYEYKFRYMHYLYIPTELVPSSNNEFANYWRDQSIALGEDALSFVFDRIKDFKGYDIFSEKSREEIYNDWLLANENWIKSYDDVQKEFNESFNTFSGRLFDNKGIPLEYLFSNEYKLHLSNEILGYNREGCAKYRSDYGTSYRKPDYKLIKFLINNIDRIPEEYRFIFKKLKDLDKIENVELREKVQMEFLLIMTDANRIFEKKYRLYDENGFNDNFYDVLFDEVQMEYIDYYAPDWKKNISENELIYMEKYKNLYDFNLLEYLYAYSLYKDEKKFSDINSRGLVNYFFSDGKPNNKLAFHFLFNIYYRSKLNDNEELISLLDDKQRSYYNFLEKVNFSYGINFNVDQINKYFDDLGKPTREMALSLLLNVRARDLISVNNELLQLLTSKEKAYFEFLKEIKFDNRLNFNSSEIEEYFDSLGLTDKGVEHILNDYDVFYSMNQESFKSYYENNYNISVFQSFLKQLDNCYYYLLKFLSNTLNINPPINEENIKDINKEYCLDLLEPAKMMEIIKYVFYSDKESKDKLSKIMYNNEFEILIKLFCKLSINQNIEDLRKMVKNFNDYKELCINMYNESEFNESEKTILYSILINGDISAREIIKNHEDLKNYSKIVFEKNNEIINTSDITFIKSMIFSNLFNIDLTQVRKILDKYGEDIHFSVLKDNIHDDKLKEVLNEYDAIIGFISSIYNSQDLDSLKIIASKINENYKNDNLDMFFNLWSNFSKMDSDIMKICGEEINEKITNFSELLNTKEEDIPIIDGEKAFILSSVNVSEDFEYDGIKINKGTNVKMIELNGLPFVTLGHVLNAFGSGGKLSDFNHPRLIGRTHLCLTGIDDNYYNLVNRDDRGIDYVQVIFDNLPSESLVIASSRDVGSRTEDNSLPVRSGYSGTYQPIRKVIIETYHGESGYNEYVYYRQYSESMQSLRPSAILIRGENPTESEIQAAVYLNVPLVKINKEKYPKRTKEEMKGRDKELKGFYKNLYEKRKQKSNEKKVIELQSLRQQIMGLYGEEKYIGRKIG